jgi:hypothetical protein
MHASRATLWAAMMHYVLQEIAPQHVNTAIDTVAKRLNVTPDDVIRLTCLAMSCHDAGRQGEDKDVWEKESSDIAAQILKEAGLPEKEAGWLAKAVLHKDDSAEYSMALLAEGINDDELSAFEYLRVLLSVADNLEIIRCKDEIYLSAIFDTLNASIPGFKDNSAYHDYMIALIKGIYHILNEQKDMHQYPQLKEGGDLLEVEFSPFTEKERWKTKRQYEHATNVFNKMLETALQSAHPAAAPLQPYLLKVCEQVTRLPPDNRLFKRLLQSRALSPSDPHFNESLKRLERTGEVDNDTTQKIMEAKKRRDSFTVVTSFNRKYLIVGLIAMLLGIAGAFCALIPPVMPLGVGLLLASAVFGLYVAFYMKPRVTRIVFHQEDYLEGGARGGDSTHHKKLLSTLGRHPAPQQAPESNNFGSTSGAHPFPPASRADQSTSATHHSSRHAPPSIPKS